MSGHRVELVVSFWVGDETGREDAEVVVRNVETVGEVMQALERVSEFSVTPSGWDGNGWYEKWPAKCGAYSADSRWGGVLGPRTFAPRHAGWHQDRDGAAWKPGEGE